MKDERHPIVEYDDPRRPGAKPRAPRRSAKRTPRDGMFGATDRGIASIMARLFLVGCALVLVGAVGDLLVLICKWIGGAIVVYVICGSAVRLVFEKWPEWVTRPCARIRAWLDN